MGGRKRPFSYHGRHLLVYAHVWSCDRGVDDQSYYSGVRMTKRVNPELVAEITNADGILVYMPDLVPLGEGYYSVPGTVKRDPINWELIAQALKQDRLSELQVEQIARAIERADIIALLADLVR